MTINKTRLAIATAGLWALFALPITRSLPDANGLVGFGFWFAILMYPVWVVFGWRWISDNAPLPLKVWAPLVFFALPIALFIADSRWHSDVAWVPGATSAVLVLLVGQLNGWDSFQSELKQAAGNLFRKPPLWFVAGSLLLISTFAQELSGFYYPAVNQALFCGVLLAWAMPYVIRRWNLQPAIAWSVVLMLAMVLVYAYR